MLNSTISEEGLKETNKSIPRKDWNTPESVETIRRAS